MSFRAVLAAIDVHDTRLEVGEKFLLVVLGSYAGADQTLYPAQSTLAGDLGCSERSVRTYLTKLEALGYIRRGKRRVGNRQTSDLITLLFEAATVAARWGVQAATDDASGGNQRPFEAATVADEPVIEPRTNSSAREAEPDGSASRALVGEMMRALVSELRVPRSRKEQTDG